MTLRQEYARPRPRAIARHRDQPGRAASRSHRPAGSAHRISLAQARNCRSNPARQGRAVLIAAPRPGTLPAPRACHAGPAWQCKAAAPQPAPGTAGAYHRRPACGLRRWIPSAGCCRR